MIPALRTEAPTVPVFLRKGPGGEFCRYLLNAERFRLLLERFMAGGPDTSACYDGIMVIEHFVKTAKVITEDEARRRFNAQWDEELLA